MTAPPNGSPAAIDVDRLHAVTITWEDGHVSCFPLVPLRRACPCAGCMAARSRGAPPVLPDSLAITTVHLAGAWGITPVWNDGHDTGIYAWESLRAACPCPACAGEADPAAVPD